MYKIYSRSRFRVPKTNPLIKMILILVIAFSTALLILKAIEPIFKSLCKEKAKSIATIVSNQQATEVMKKYSYDDLFSVEKDADGNVKMIKSNIVSMNEIISEVPNKIQSEINEKGKDNIEISLRKLHGDKSICREWT